MRGRGEVEGNDLCLNRVEVGKVGGGRRGEEYFHQNFVMVGIGIFLLVWKGGGAGEGVEFGY